MCVCRGGSIVWDVCGVVCVYFVVCVWLVCVWFVWCVYVHVCGVCMHEHVCVYVYLSWWLPVSSPSWQKLENMCDQVSHSVAAGPLHTDTAVWKAKATASSSPGKPCCFTSKVILFGWILFLFMFWAHDVAFGGEMSKVFTIRAQPSIRVTINLQLDGRLQTTSIQCWRCKGRATLTWRSDFFPGETNTELSCAQWMEVGYVDQVWMSIDKGHFKHRPGAGYRVLQNPMRTSVVGAWKNKDLLEEGSHLSAAVS